jgi:hypothetical protein
MVRSCRMSQKTMKVHRKTVQGLRKELFGQFMDDAREMPLRWRIPLVFYILKGKKKAKKDGAK